MTTHVIYRPISTTGRPINQGCSFILPVNASWFTSRLVWNSVTQLHNIWCYSSCDSLSAVWLNTNTCATGTVSAKGLHVHTVTVTIPGYWNKSSVRCTNIYRKASPCVLICCLLCAHLFATPLYLYGPCCAKVIDHTQCSICTVQISRSHILPTILSPSVDLCAFGVLGVRGEVWILI